MAKKSDNVIFQVYNSFFSNRKDKIQDLDNKVNDLILKNIPSFHNNGQDRAISDLLINFLNQKQNPQYSYTDNKNKQPKELAKLLGNMDPGFTDANNRKDLYNTYRFLVKNIPQLNAALSIIVENIMSPDELFKEMIKIVPMNDTFEVDSSIIFSNTKIESNDINNIVNILGIEEKLFSWLSNCLLTGNTYVEIIDSREATSSFLSEDSIIKCENSNTLKSYAANQRKLLEDKYKILNLTETANIIMEMEYDKNDSKQVKITENEFVRNIIEEDVFIIEDFGRQDQSIINSVNKNKAMQASNKKFKDFRDHIYFTDLQKEEDERKRRVGRPSKVDLDKNRLDREQEDRKTRLEDIILKQHESENVIRLTNSGFLLGYLIVKEKPMSAGVQNKIFGSIGNSIDLTTERNKNTSNKITDLLIDKIVQKYKTEFRENGVEREHLDNPDVNKLIASIITEKKTANIRFVPPSNVIEFINYPEYGVKEYGVSILDSCLFMAKYYLALLISYTIFNITRAPEKRVFKIEIGNDPNVRQAIEETMTQVKQKELMFQNFDRLDAMPKELTAFNDIFLPSVNGQSAVSVEGIPGQSGNIDISYLDEIRKMVIYATKVPPSLLGDTENSYHTSASQENYKFARTIVRYQQQFQNQLTDAISKIYYLISGSGLKFNKMTFNPPAFTKVEQVATMIGQADIICNFVSDSFGMDPETQQPNFPKKYIAKEFAKFLDWDKLEEIFNKYKNDKARDDLYKKLKPQDPAADNSNAADGNPEEA